MSTAPPHADLLRFETLARDFLAAAERGDETAMAGLLDARGDIVRRLEGDGPATVDAGDRAARRIVESILDLDRRAEELLTERRSRVGSELREMNRGRRGLAGYAAGGHRAGKWIDERG